MKVFTCAESAHLCRGLAHLYEVGLHVSDGLVEQFPRVLQLPYCQASAVYCQSCLLSDLGC